MFVCLFVNWLVLFGWFVCLVCLFVLLFVCLFGFVVEAARPKMEKEKEKKEEQVMGFKKDYVGMLADEDATNRGDYVIAATSKRKYTKKELAARKTRTSSSGAWKSQGGSPGDHAKGKGKGGNGKQNKGLGKGVGNPKAQGKARQTRTAIRQQDVEEESLVAGREEKEANHE